MTEMLGLYQQIKYMKCHFLDMSKIDAQFNWYKGDVKKHKTTNYEGQTKKW